MTPTLECNIEDIRRTYQLLGHAAETEIRSIDHNKHGVKSYFVHSEEEFVDICVQQNKARANVYVGQSERFAGGTRAENVVASGLIVIDIDPERPDPKQNPATDMEMMAAKVVCDKIVEDLQMRIPQIVYSIGMSGNGYQIWLPHSIVSLNEPDARKEMDEIRQAFIRDIAAAYNMKGLRAKVDHIGDLARIIKVIGTVSYKGIATNERPHRVATWVRYTGRAENREFLSYMRQLKAQQHTECTEPKERQLALPPGREDEAEEIVYRKLSILLRRNSFLRRAYAQDGVRGGPIQFDKGTYMYTYASRSEADAGLVALLYKYGFADREIDIIMKKFKCSKWGAPETTDAYKKHTLNSAKTKVMTNNDGIEQHDSDIFGPWLNLPIIELLKFPSEEQTVYTFRFANKEGKITLTKDSVTDSREFARQYALLFDTLLHPISISEWIELFNMWMRYYCVEAGASRGINTSEQILQVVKNMCEGVDYVRTFEDSDLTSFYIDDMAIWAPVSAVQAHLERNKIRVPPVTVTVVLRPFLVDDKTQMRYIRGIRERYYPLKKHIFSIDSSRIRDGSQPNGHGSPELDTQPLQTNT